MIVIMMRMIMCPLTVIVTHNKEWMIMTGAIPFSLAKEFCLIGGINQSPTECLVNRLTPLVWDAYYHSMYCTWASMYFIT